jgi:hypothetical protein
MRVFAQDRFINNPRLRIFFSKVLLDALLFGPEGLDRVGVASRVLSKERAQAGRPPVLISSTDKNGSTV